MTPTLMPSHSNTAVSNPYLRSVATIAALALLYFLTGRLGLMLAIPPGYATAIFPPAGFALAALLLYGNRVWPGVLLGSFALNLSMSPNFESVFSTTGLVALSIASGAVVQGWLGAALVRRWVGFPAPLADEGEIFKFFLLGGPVSCLVNSLVGSTTLLQAGAISADAYAFTWWTWWVGDVIGVFVATPLVFIALAPPRDLWRKRVLSVALPLLVTLAVVIALFVRVSAWEDQAQRTELNNYAHTVTETLQRNLDVYTTTLESVERFFVASGGRVSRQQFTTFSTETMRRHPGLQALSWQPLVQDAERDRFERAVQAEGFANFQIQERSASGQPMPATRAADYVPVTFIEPYASNERALGFNLLSNPARRAALLQARDTGQMMATGRIKLVQEKGDQFGVLLIQPVYSTEQGLSDVASRIKHLQGYATAVLRTGDMFGTLVQELNSRDISLRLIDETVPQAPEVLYQLPSWDSAPMGRGWDQVIELPVGGRQWRLEFRPMSRYLVLHRAWQAWATLAGGLLFAGMLGAFLLLITGRTAQVQQKVDERTHELKVILDNVVDGIISIDELGIVKSFNCAAETIFGYPAGEVIGQNVKMLMPEPYRSAHDGYLLNYRNSGLSRIEGMGRELIGQRKGGDTFPMDLAISRSIHNERPLFIGLVRDITERKRLDKLKSEFVSTVSHELRTPLTSISGALGLLAGGALGEMTGTVKQLIDMAHKNSLRLTVLINDLLDMDKLMAGKMVLDLQAQPLMPLVAQALEGVRSYGEQYGVSFVLGTHEEVQVRVDAGRLIQVFNNLLSNAAKFSPQGGQVEVAVRRLTDDTVRVEVSDSGCGIPDSFKAHIFQKFSQADSSDTRQKGGTGLGLAISKELIEHMNGAIGFTSVSGQGTCFYFDLPL